MKNYDPKQEIRILFYLPNISSQIFPIFILYFDLLVALDTLSHVLQG